MKAELLKQLTHVAALLGDVSSRHASEVSVQPKGGTYRRLQLEHPKLIAYLAAAATLCDREGARAAANDLYRTSLWLCRKANLIGSRIGLDIANRYAAALHRSGDTARAANVYRQVLQLYRHRFGDGAAAFYVIQDQFAQVLAQSGSHVQAEELYRATFLGLASLAKEQPKLRTSVDAVLLRWIDCCLAMEWPQEKLLEELSSLAERTGVKAHDLFARLTTPRRG